MYGREEGGVQWVGSNERRGGGRREALCSVPRDDVGEGAFLAAQPSRSLILR